ncbi:MAG: DUF2800 domain-containing protein [Betaproteobacteria bacterium]
MSTHARLSASAASRWMNCSGSVKLSEGQPNPPTIHSATGTVAHHMAAHCLEKDTAPSDILGQVYDEDGFKITVDQEMVDAVNLYISEIEADAQPGDGTWVEMPLLDALAKIDPDFGGTADYVRYRPSAKHLRVMDFKYGAGTYVEADDNKQLKIYALGAVLQVAKPVTEVEVVIVQPRFEGARPVRSWSFKASGILDFVADLQEAAEKTRLPGPPLAAGDWCGFCPAKRICPEITKKRNAILAAEFGEVVNHAELATLLAAVPQVKAQIKAIEELAYREATAGREIPGFKLVDKRATRKWKDGEKGALIEWAQTNAIDPYEKPELKSPAALEKELAKDAPRGKKKEIGKVLEPFVEKVSSGYALVPASDDRPAVKQISINDFAVVDGAAETQ